MPRAVSAGGHRLIKAPLHRLWQMLSRLESHPRFAGLWYYADLIDRSQNSTVVELRGFFGGLPITSVQRFSLKPPGRIEFRQARGTLRDLAGFYVLRDADGETELEVKISADAGIPLFSDSSVRRILAGHVESVLSKMKASAERDLVRLPSRRGQAASGASLPGGAEGVVQDGPREPDGAGEADWEGEPAEGEPAEEQPAAPSPGQATGQPVEKRRRRRRRRRRPSLPEQTGGAS